MNYSSRDVAVGVGKNKVLRLGQLNCKCNGQLELSLEFYSFSIKESIKTYCHLVTTHIQSHSDNKN